MTDFNTRLDAGGADLAAIIAETEDGRLYLEIAKEGATPTHRIVPDDVWKRMFGDYVDRGQIAIRRGLEIDRLKRQIARMEKRCNSR